MPNQTAHRSKTPLLILALLAGACADPQVSGPTPLDACEGQSAGFDCSGIDLLGMVPVQALGGSRLNDVWGWTDPVTGREYAIVGRDNGTSFVDVTEGEPRIVGDLPLTPGAHPSTWRDMKVHADHAFIVADAAGDHGMQVFDLRRLRNVTATPAVFEADAVYRGFGSAHNIAIDPQAGLAVAVGANSGGQTCGGGLHMIDITSPGAPEFAGCFNDPRTGANGNGYTHDAQCVTYRGPDAEHRGRRICLGSNISRLSIVDVTDPANPVALAAASYPASAYLHQGWLTEDQRYFLTDDEADEFAGGMRTRTLVWDVSDLDDPVLVHEFFGRTFATDHNLYVRGDRVYQANYTSGLRVLDITNPENPVEIAYFDTVAGPNQPGFSGAWSVYPFFESERIVVSSIDEGLFVLRLHDELR